MTGKNTKKFIFWLIFSVFVIASLMFAIYKTYSFTINVPENTKNILALLNALKIDGASQKEMPATENILILGVPGNYENNNAPDLTDTIIIASADFTKNSAALISIPRDLFVKNPLSRQSFTKINALYKIGKENQLGADLIKSKVEEISGLKINHYLIVSLEAVKNAIDLVGGINIPINKDLEDFYFPTADKKTTFFGIEEGFRFLDGHDAVKYIRSRHTEGGDFDRLKRQQDIIMALKKKIFSKDDAVKNILQAANIYQKIKNQIQTDISLENIKNFTELGGKISSENIKTIYVDTISPGALLTEKYVKIGNDFAFTLIPKAGLENYKYIREYINKELEL